MLESRLSKTCDNCKIRKVRCSGSRQPNQIACGNCTKRQTTCHFSHYKRRMKTLDERPHEGHSPEWPPETRAEAAHLPDSQSVFDRPEQSHSQPPSTGRESISDCARHAGVTQVRSSKVYMDEMLEHEGVRGKEFHASLIPKSEKQNMSSSSLSLFSDSDIRSISEKLSNPQFGDLIESYADSINKRLHRKANKSYPRVSFRTTSEPVILSEKQRAGNIQSYFEHVHPVFPLLVKQDFEQQILHHEGQEPESDLPFLVLYSSIQAIGSQYGGDGAFEPGRGKSWQLFQTALNRLDELIGSKPCLESVQAVLAMFLFTMTHCGGQIAESLLSEAARMAQFVRLNKGSRTLTDGAHQRTFWIIYSLEKLSCFCQGRTSVIHDEDIGCHIPNVPEAIFEDFNWFLSSIRLGRLLSKAQIALFSVSATLKSRDQYQEDLHRTRDELETWRLSIPSSFRPGERFYRAHFAGSGSLMAALRTHLLYHNVVMVLCRVGLQIAGTNPGGPRQDICQIFMRSARQVIDLTGHIEVEPYAPAVLLTVIPSSAFLSLFHLVIDNPSHSETKDNLAFLEVGAGYFRRLEYVTKQEFPFSVFPKLVAVAREYMHRLEQRERPDPVVEIETYPPLPADPAQNIPLDMQAMSHIALPDVAAVPDQSRVDFEVPLYPIDGNGVFHPPPLAAEGLANHTDVLPPVQENGIVDFFENLLDGTYNSLYGADFTWQ